MVFVAEDEMIDDEPRIRLMYSIYDAGADTWSGALSVVNEYQTVDLHPSIASDGNNIWVAWQRFHTTLNEFATIDEFLDTTEIVVARFDNMTGAFTDFKVVANRVFLDENPAIAINGNDLFVAWAHDRNIYASWAHDCEYDCEHEHAEESGIGSIEITGRLFANSAWSEPVTLVDESGMILGMDAAFFNGKFQVAFVTDSGHSETHDDRALIVVDSTGSITYEPTRGVQILNPQFTFVNGEQALSWFQGEMIDDEGRERRISDIRYMTVGGQHQSLLANPNMPTANFRILSNNLGGTAVIYPVAEGGIRNFYARLYNNGNLGNPFRLVETGGFARHFDAILNNNGEFNIVYNNSVIVFAGENDPTFNETNDLRAVKIGTPVNIRIAHLYYFEDGMRLGETLPVIMYVENLGGIPIDGIVIEVNGSVIDAISVPGGLQAGNRAGIQFELPIPLVMAELTAFMISVRPDGLVGADSDNSRVITLGRSNFSLSLKRLDNEDGTVTLIADVWNLSDFSTSGRLYVYRGELGGAVIDSVELGAIAGMERVFTDFVFDPAYIVPQGREFEILHLRVESDREEASIGNMSEFVVIHAAASDDNGDTNLPGGTTPPSGSIIIIIPPGGII